MYYTNAFLKRTLKLKLLERNNKFSCYFPARKKTTYFLLLSSKNLLKTRFYAHMDKNMKKLVKTKPSQGTIFTAT